MFISKAEKSKLDSRISYLEGKVKYQDELITALGGRIKEVAENISLKGWTPAARAAQSVRMKKAWADKKART